MTNTEVIKKLIGEINPVGETYIDEQRLYNLGHLCDVVENLLDEIHKLTIEYKENKQYSVKCIFEKAYKFKQNIKVLYFNESEK